MLILQSILVYGFVIWVMTYFGNIAYKCQYPQGFGRLDTVEGKNRSLAIIFTKNYFLIPILVFSFFAAVRFQVGVDCETYKEIFYDLGRFGESLRGENIEEGFVFLSKLTYNITGAHYLLFFILAFLQIGLYYIALQKDRQALKFLGIAIFIGGHYWSLMNGMRQNIAACAFVAMIPLLLDKKWSYLVIGTLLAMTMHRSALLIAPLAVVAYLCRNKILNKYLQLGLLVACFFMMNKFNGIFSDSILDFATQAGYDSDEIEVYTNLEATEYKFGLRMILQYVVFGIAVWYSDKMYCMYNSRIFNTMYNLFFIGICLKLLFYNNFTVGRLIYYLVCFTPVILSYFMFYLWKTKKWTLLFAVISLLTIQMGWSIYSDVSHKGVAEAMLYKFDL